MSKKKSSDILRQNIWQNYFEEVLARDYEKSHEQTNQKFIINKNYHKNRPLSHTENLNDYYQYYANEVCPNHKHSSKNNSCHLVQVPICHTTSHGFVVVNTIHGIRLKHSDIVSKKTPRHKGQQKNSSLLLTNNATGNANGTKHTNGSVERSRSGKLFMIVQQQQQTSEQNSHYKNNERHLPHIVNGRCLQITESIKSLRKKSNDKKSTINESHKNSNLFEKGKLLFDSQNAFLYDTPPPVLQVKSIKTSKITDRDVIFGNARLILRKHNYGWEKSRIEWLLELERKNAA